VIVIGFPFPVFNPMFLSELQALCRQPVESLVADETTGASRINQGKRAQVFELSEIVEQPPHAALMGSE
jgi:hypothetical protein